MKNLKFRLTIKTEEKYGADLMKLFDKLIPINESDNLKGKIEDLSLILGFRH